MADVDVTVELEPPARPSQEQTLGKYTGLRKIGEGGQGTVYAAYDPTLDRAVALKVLARSAAAARTRFLREARSLARVEHPNVVRVYEVETIGGIDFIVMELLDGETLRAWIAAPRRRPVQILAAFLAVARGLVAVHDAGLVHRDVKPDNVICTADGRFVLVDFGLARTVDDGDDAPEPSSSPDATQLGDLKGTPAYMAPEQLAGSAAGPAADQFALCVSIWEALAGRRPFGETLDERRRDAAERPCAIVLPQGSIPRVIGGVLRRGLAGPPADRWPSIAVLARRLRRAIAIRRGAPWAGLALGVLAASLWLLRPDRTAAIIAADPGCLELEHDLDVIDHEIAALDPTRLERRAARDDLRFHATRLTVAIAGTCHRPLEQLRLAPADPQHAVRTTCLAASIDDLSVATSLVTRLPPDSATQLQPPEQIAPPAACEGERPARRVRIARPTLARLRGAEVALASSDPADLGDPCARAIADPEDNAVWARAAEQRYDAAMQCGDETLIARTAVEIPYAFYIAGAEQPAVYYTTRARAESATARAPTASLGIPLQIFAARDAWDDRDYHLACVGALTAHTTLVAERAWSYHEVVLAAVGKFCAELPEDTARARTALAGVTDPAGRLALAERAWPSGEIGLRRLGYLAWRSGALASVRAIEKLIEQATAQATAQARPTGAAAPSLRVRVVDPQGHPAANVVIDLVEPQAMLDALHPLMLSGVRSATTDAAGTATITAAAAGWILVAHRGDHEASSPRAMTQADLETPPTLRLAETVVLSGRIGGELHGLQAWVVAGARLPGDEPIGGGPTVGTWVGVARVLPDATWKVRLPLGRYQLNVRLATRIGPLAGWQPGERSSGLTLHAPGGTARRVEIRSDTSDVVEFKLWIFEGAVTGTTATALIADAATRKVGFRYAETLFDRRGRSGHYDQFYPVDIPAGGTLCVSVMLPGDDWAQIHGRPARCTRVADEPTVVIDGPPVR